MPTFKSYPKKPFITSTLQQSAQNEILSVGLTNDAVQKLWVIFGYINRFNIYFRRISNSITTESSNGLW